MFEVWFFRRGIGLKVRGFKSFIKACTFANLESTQMEADGGKFRVYEN